MFIYKATKANEEAKQNVFKCRRVRKRNWMVDFTNAVKYSTTQGYYEMNISKPLPDVQKDLEKILNRLGYTVSDYEKFWRLGW